MSQTESRMRSPAEERVVRALRFERPDRTPRFFSFWPEVLEVWRRSRGKEFDPDTVFGNDVRIAAANETTWPTAAKEIERSGNTVVHRTGWGALERTRIGAKFSESLGTSLPERVDPDSLRFDDPLLEMRYDGLGRHVEAWRPRFAVFAKTGGPYLRAAFMRGQANFLMDVAEDPGWVKAFVERVTDHMATIGAETIRRFHLQDTGIGIYDDACTLHGPVTGPKAYEKLFLPSLCTMVRAYRDAGARYVFHHCDGNVTELLEMWVAAGIDVVHPLETRCNPHPRAVLERFGGRLAVMGGIDNCVILPRGNREEIRAHVRGLLEAGRNGGFVLAPHSIGEDVTLETMEYILSLLEP
jgi:uroporphyrinogen decarboxylase